ncbi:hypothetical protein AVEN_106501-1 [Araneus ventricosus]|uniref:Uncharacterized protein n=1 Tax=Araneus ventricosus TaxID=182803 RepID=A0A4Y2SC04_ARAVE|nr:hypothetical protein AVEN_106501-1 [Araneus ventricosus]
MSNNNLSSAKIKRRWCGWTLHPLFVYLELASIGVDEVFIPFLAIGRKEIASPLKNSAAMDVPNDFHKWVLLIRVYGWDVFVTVSAVNGQE